MSHESTDSPTGEGETFDETQFRAELESEFSAIAAEIDRINVQEKVGGAAKRMILNRFREHRRRSRRVSPDAPEWRRRLDEALEGALDKLIEDGLEERPDGTLQLTFHSSLVGTHGVPVLTAVLDGLRAKLLEGAQSGGPLAGLAPAIARAIEQFRTSFAGAPPPDAQQEAAETERSDAASAQAPGKSAPSRPADPFAALFQGFAAMAQQSVHQGKKGKKGDTRRGAQTFSARFGSDAPPGPDKTGGPVVEPTETSPSSKGPTVQIDLAGLLGAMFQGMSKGTAAARPEVATTESGSPPAASPPPQEPGED